MIKRGSVLHLKTPNSYELLATVYVILIRCEIALVSVLCICYSDFTMTMETYSSRGSSLFTTFSTVLFTIASLNHFTSYFYHASPSGSISVVESSKVDFAEFKPYHADQVRFSFDMSVDLSTEYNWNVNQIYLFVVATYETDKNKKNEVVIYDRILRTVEEFSFSLKNQRVKYPLRDEHKNTLAGRKVKLSIRYQLMPIFGFMRIRELPSESTFKIPDEYNAVESKGKSEKKKSR